MKPFQSILFVLFLFSSNVDAQDSLSIVKPPVDIYTIGIPPISKELEESVIPYSFSRYSFLQDWHPLGKEILIVSELGAVQQAYSVALPGGMRRQLTFFNEPPNQSLYDPIDGKYIVVSKDKDGDEYYQIYRQDLRNGKTTLLSKGGDTYVSDLLWNQKGDKLYYSSLQPKSSTKQLFSVNPEIPSSNHAIIDLDGPNWSLSALSSDEKNAILSSRFEGSNILNILWSYDIATGNKKQILPSKGKSGLYFPIGFSKDDRGIFLWTNENTEFNQLAYYDFFKQELIFLTDINWGVRRATLSPDKTKIAFTVNEAGVVKTYIFYTESNKYELIQNMPIGFISSLLWSKNSNSLAFQLSTSYAYSDIYEWDMNTGKITPWVQNETGGFDASTIPEPELIKWKSFDGLEISGFLYPAAKKFGDNRPVIIDIHGGPVTQALPLFNNNVNYYTNELGVSVIFPNIRGSAGFGSEFTELDNGTKREDALKDIGTLIDLIEADKQFDSSRIMISGGSYGGYMTYRVAIEYNDQIRCTIPSFGMSDLLSYFNTIDGPYKEFFAQEYGDPNDPEIVEYLKKISPLNNAQKISKPMFIIQGKNDPRVPYTESEQMMEAIKKNGGTVWYLVANNEGHGFHKKENNDYLFLATVEFIKKYLLD